MAAPKAPKMYPVPPVLAEAIKEALTEANTQQRVAQALLHRVAKNHGLSGSIDITPDCLNIFVKE